MTSILLLILKKECIYNSITHIIVLDSSKKYLYARSSIVSKKCVRPCIYRIVNCFTFIRTSITILF